MCYDDIKNFITLKIFDAKIENLDEVTKYLEDVLKKEKVDDSKLTILSIVLEEIFVNIASYAYVGTQYEKNPTMQFAADVKDGYLYLVFIDKGIPFDPLQKEDPDLTTSVDEKPIGGLGIYMSKKWATEISYERIDDQNVLIFKKKL